MRILHRLHETGGSWKEEPSLRPPHGTNLFKPVRFSRGGVFSSITFAFTEGHGLLCVRGGARSICAVLTRRARSFRISKTSCSASMPRFMPNRVSAPGRAAGSRKILRHPQSPGSRFPASRTITEPTGLADRRPSLIRPGPYQIVIVGHGRPNSFPGGSLREMKSQPLRIFWSQVRTPKGANFKNVLTVRHTFCQTCGRKRGSKS